MSTTQDIEIFRGGTWEECGAFIQRIRAAAWKEGKLRDPGWTADFASLHFAGDALAWYCRLPPDTQEDWPKLQAALAEKWSPPGGDDHSEPPNVPIAAAAAPSAKVNNRIDYLERGIIKALVPGKETLYVKMEPGDKICTLTNDVGKALRVRFDSNSNSKIFECVERLPFSWLATHWYQDIPNLGRGSKHFCRLTVLDCDSLKSPLGFRGPFQVATFRIANSGEVTVVWSNGTTETTLAAFTSEDRVNLVPDREAFQAEYPGEKPITLFIQNVE